MNEKIMPIVTINFNGKNDTLALINSLNNSDESYMLVIVDNNSPKENEFSNLKTGIEKIFNKKFVKEDFDDNKCDSGFILEHTDDAVVVLLHSKDNGGFSKGTNIGLEYAIKKLPNSKYMTILNNDTEVEKHFLKRIVDIMDKNDEIAAGMGTILYYGQEEPYIWSIGGYPVWKKGQCEHVHKDEIMNENIHHNKEYFYRDFTSGCFTVFKTKVLKDIGLLDEDYFFAGEEYQYSVDIRKTHKMIWVPKSVIYHKSILHVGNGSSHKINSIEWQYSAYRTKCVFINKNKGLFYRLMWRTMLLYHLSTKTKKRLISQGVCSKKQFSYFKKQIEKHMSDKKYLSEEFKGFKQRISEI